MAGVGKRWEDAVFAEAPLRKVYLHVDSDSSGRIRAPRCQGCQGKATGVTGGAAARLLRSVACCFCHDSVCSAPLDILAAEDFSGTQQTWLN